MSYAIGWIEMIDKQDKFIEFLNELKNKRFTGFVRINFSQGGITRVEKNEEVLKNTELKK